ncbi:MAG: alpha-ketoglutarate-dependent dioxygenase AlkB [Robiginitalea sp.]
MEDLLKSGFIELPDASLMFEPGFLAPRQADRLFAVLQEKIPWRQDEIRVFGKTYLQPRLTALYGNNGSSYSYSGITMEPEPFLPELRSLKGMVEKYSGHVYTTCLLNLYRDGNDSNGWHADDEKELGPSPVIASVSLGDTRTFHLKHRSHKALRYRMRLEHGSLLVMGGPMQHHWLHQIPKTRQSVGPRINLTFRNIGQTG